VPDDLFLGVDGRLLRPGHRPGRCQACLNAQPPFAGVDIVDWRLRHGALVANAAFSSRRRALPLRRSSATTPSIASK
jgi:hypothetical protein